MGSSNSTARSQLGGSRRAWVLWSSVIWERGKEKKSSEEVGGRERAGKTEKSQQLPEGTVWRSLQGPEETAKLVGREALLRSSVAHGWGPGPWRRVDRDSP